MKWYDLEAEAKGANGYPVKWPCDPVEIVEVGESRSNAKGTWHYWEIKVKEPNGYYLATWAAAAPPPLGMVNAEVSYKAASEQYGEQWTLYAPYVSGGSTGSANVSQKTFSPDPTPQGSSQGVKSGQDGQEILSRIGAMRAAVKLVEIGVIKIGRLFTAAEVLHRYHMSGAMASLDHIGISTPSVQGNAPPPPGGPPPRGSHGNREH